VPKSKEPLQIHGAMLTPQIGFIMMDQAVNRNHLEERTGLAFLRK